MGAPRSDALDVALARSADATVGDEACRARSLGRVSLRGVPTRGNLLICAALSACLGGCGFVASGIWADDEDNWERAFSTLPHAHSKVVHSLCWRSPHFTYEAAYWFEFEPSAEFEREIFERNDFVRLEAESPSHFRELSFHGHSLKWFAPKRGADAYEAWGRRDEPHPNFLIMIDRETRAIFMKDMQL